MSGTTLSLEPQYLDGSTYDQRFVNTDGDTMMGALNLPAGGLNVGSGQLTVTGAGNVGIGVIKPLKKLDVNGTILSSGSANGGLVVSGAPAGFGSGYGNLFLWRTSGEQIGNEKGVAVGAGRNVHQKWDNSWHSNDMCLTHQAMTMDEKGFHFRAYDGQGECMQGTVPEVTERLTIKQDGRVGIGTTEPGARLDVSYSASDTPGDVALVFTNTEEPNNNGTGFGIRYGKIQPDGPTDSGLILDRNFNDVWYPAMAFARDTGNVGIGTTDPRARLHIENEGATDSVAIYAHSDLEMVVPSGTDIEFGFMQADGTVSRQAIFYQNNGYLGLGMGQPEVPQERLHVVGNILATGTITTASGGLSCSSSRDVKKDIAELSDVELGDILATLNQLTLVRYRYKEEPSTRKLHLGVIAEDSPDEIVSENGKAISLSDYVSFVAAAVKALAAQTDSLSDRILAENERLRQENAGLQARLDTMEQRFADMDKRLAAVERK